MGDYIYLKKLQLALLHSPNKVNTIKKMFNIEMNDLFYQLVLDRIIKSDLKFINILKTNNIYEIINYLKRLLFSFYSNHI